MYVNLKGAWALCQRQVAFFYFLFYVRLCFGLISREPLMSTRADYADESADHAVARG